jgi:hypothetical protein
MAFIVCLMTYSAFIDGYMAKAAGPQYTPAQLRAAIAHAETGSFKNPYIRTTYQPKGNISTAYGPTQVTQTLYKDTLQRFGKQYTPEEKRWMRMAIAQGQLMRQRPAKDPVYGYGGKGHMGSTQTLRDMGKQVHTKMIADKYKRSGWDLEKFIQRWRGVPRSKDPSYYQKVTKHLQSTPR